MRWGVNRGMGKGGDVSVEEGKKGLRKRFDQGRERTGIVVRETEVFD